jgi:cathepsin E
MLSLLSLLLLVPAVLGTPFVKIRDSPITIPIAVRVNTTGSANILEQDRVRARSFVQAAKDKAARVKAGKLSPDAVVSVPVTNAAVRLLSQFRFLIFRIVRAL